MSFTSLGIYDLHINRNFWLKSFMPRNGRLNLERRLKEYAGINTLLVTDSGRSALFLALQMLDCKDKDVLVNAYTTDVVHNTIKSAGARPVCFDIDPLTLLPDLDSLDQRITEKTCAVIHTGLFGFPGKPLELVQRMKKLGIPVIEDSCNSFGSSTGSFQSGTIGDLAIVSFRVGKPISSGGGALFVNNTAYLSAFEDVKKLIRTTPWFSDLLRASRVLLDHVMLNPLFLRYIARPIRKLTKNTKLGRLIIKGGVVDTSSLPGFGCIFDMGEIQSTLCLLNLNEYPEQIEKRKRNGALLREAISKLNLQVVAEYEKEYWNGLFFPVLLPGNFAEEFQKHCRSAGFDVSRFHYEVPGTILDNDYEKDFPGTSCICERLVCLPVPESVTGRNKIVSVLNDFLVSF